MYEFHGFAVIACGDADTDEADMILVLSRLERLLETMGSNGEFFRLGRGVNGLQSLTVSGRRSTRQQAIVDVFRWLAEHAPASYGLLYVHDDLDGRREAAGCFRVFRLARGRCEEMPDPFLSPIPRGAPSSFIEGRPRTEIGFAAPLELHPPDEPWRAVEAERRIVARIPLEQIWDSSGTLEAERVRPLVESNIRSMLQTKPFRFVVAATLSPLRWIPTSQCLDFWKSEVKPRLVKQSDRANSHDGRWYLAYEWRLDTGERVVELDKHGDE